MASMLTNAMSQNATTTISQPVMIQMSEGVDPVIPGEQLAGR